MSRLAVIPVVLLLALAAAAVADEDGDLTFRTYDVSVLGAPRVHRHGPPLGALPSENIRAQWAEEEEDEEPESFLEIDQVIDLIRETVEPASWDDYGEIDRRGDRLFVRNRGHVLKKLSEVLEEAETAASRRVLFGVKVVTLPAGRYSDRAGLDAAVADGALLESGSMECYPGIRSSLKVTNRIRYVRDYDVEIAQTASIADPLVAAGEEGFAIDLVAHPTVDGGRVLVEALVRRGTFDRPIRSVDLSDTEGRLGVVDLPVFRQVASFSTGLVDSGKTMAIPFVSNDRTFVVLITPTVLGRGGGRFLDVGAISRRPLRYTVGSPPEAEEDMLPLTAPGIGRGESELPLDGVEGLLELIVNNEDPWYWEEEGRIDVIGRSLLVVRAKKEVMDRVRKFVSAREAELLRPIELDLRVYSVDGEVVPGSRKPLETAPGKLLRAGRVSTLPGRPAVILAGNTANFVADYDVEVAQEAQIPDPMIGQSFEGLAANLTARLSLDGSKVRLGVGLLFAQRSLVGEPVRTGAKFLGAIDGLSEKRTVFNETVEFPLGSEYVIDGGPDPTSRGRLAIVIRATGR